MNPLFPVYTEKTECQDCYKCVRECPVKAIQVKDGSASIINDKCIMCGHCVNTCPVGAKQVRSDLKRAKQLIRRKDTMVSLAPSWVSEFPDVSRGQIIRALKQLGFKAVSETALGAQEVSAHAAAQFSSGQNAVMISSACPAVVRFLKQYHPAMGEHVTPLLSPVLAHAALMQQHNSNCAVVFIGPCIAKKWESDHHPDLLNIALTFDELRTWLSEKDIQPQTLAPHHTDDFWPDSAQEGALYPVDGGMIAGIRSNCPVNDAQFMAFSGIDAIENAVEELDNTHFETPLFLELLACRGGCVNGPCTKQVKSTIAKRLRVFDYADDKQASFPRQPQININEQYSVSSSSKPAHSDDALRQALRDVGKFTHKDELNCGGCGYDSCRDFAKAMLDGIAEKTMCVSYMRKMAQKKANALITAMPSGVVMVNSQLKIVECNANFAKLAGENARLVYDAAPGMEGADLKKVISFAGLFQDVLESGQDILGKDIHDQDIILHGSVFSIEKHQLVGGIFQDVTTPAVQKEQIIGRTRQVIEKNMATVQQIACLLGENASETQVMLDSIIQSYSTQSVEAEYL